MEEIINKIPTNKAVLISPLDWGLGHATRCVPLIRLLIKQQNRVFVCTAGAPKKILETACPEATIIPFSGYQIRYPRRGRWMLLFLMAQLPKIAWRAFTEKQQLKKIILKIKPNLIISDNRLGFRSSRVPSIYITHQLGIKTGSTWLDNLARFCHYSYINQFDACWVPDKSGSESLAGELSHPVKLPRIPVHYIGWLSRFHPKPQSKKYALAIVLSGPEPQRTIFEQLILSQLIGFDKPALLVRGLPEQTNQLIVPENLEVHAHLPGEVLSENMQASQLVIARSGYSTIMDLVAIKQEAILVPTPGQTEQEYLARYLSNHRLFSTVSQADFVLHAAIEEHFKKTSAI